MEYVFDADGLSLTVRVQNAIVTSSNPKVATERAAKMVRAALKSTKAAGAVIYSNVSQEEYEYLYEDCTDEYIGVLLRYSCLAAAVEYTLDLGSRRLQNLIDNNCGNYEEYNEGLDIEASMHPVIVIMDYPDSYDDKSVDLFSALDVISAMSDITGVYILLVSSRDDMKHYFPIHVTA